MAKQNWEKKTIVQDVSKQKPLIPRFDSNKLPFISFSFRYFTQCRYFGVGDQDAAWFANLYNRLKDLSVKTGSILDDFHTRRDYRFHPIDWNAKECPITIEDLNLPKNIIDNMEEDFIWQFQLSMGTGRVIGFFNEDYSVFYIVLLDPKHNIQPAKDYGYAVDETAFAITKYEQIETSLIELESLRKQCQYIDQCPISELGHHIDGSDFFVRIDPELAYVYNGLINEGTFIQAFNDFLEKEYFK